MPNLLIGVELLCSYPLCCVLISFVAIVRAMSMALMHSISNREVDTDV